MAVRVRAVLAASLVGVGALVGAPTAFGAPSADGGERISRYDVLMSVRRDGSMHVRELLTYDFDGSAGRHGIKRELPVEFAHDSDHTRVYPLTNAKASSPTGAPADLETAEGPTVTLRVGDPDQTVSGVQQYVLDYDLGGVVNTLPDGQELYWNAIGDEWTVPIDTASVTVEGPVAVARATCFKGVQASTQVCTQKTGADGKAGYSATGLQPGQGLTVVAGFPSGTFPGAAPILEEIWTPQRAFALTPATGAGALGLLALVGGGTGLLVARRGRDRRYLNLVPGLTPGVTLGSEVDAGTARTGMFRREPVAVQFTPPKGMYPGQLGTLIDEEANVVDVTATIVDLAVRGFLRIEEVEQSGWFRSGDWRLVMIWPAPTEQLEQYETTLLRAIFAGRNEVLLSDIKQTFRSHLQRVQTELYEHVTRRGWFRGNPRTVRNVWRAAGLGLVILGAALTWLLASRTHAGLVGVGLVLGGLVAAALAGRMPARTATGTALLAQARGFRLYLETAEANQIKWEEGQDVFSRYLPFAIVFGVAERWAKVFAQLAASGAAVATPTWYVGSYGYGGPGLFDFNGFGHAMDSFATTTSGSIAAATPSSSGGSGFGGGGFSGGGGGGGGGGSW